MQFTFTLKNLRPSGFFVNATVLFVEQDRVFVMRPCSVGTCLGGCKVILERICFNKGLKHPRRHTGS